MNYLSSLRNSSTGLTQTQKQSLQWPSVDKEAFVYEDGYTNQKKTERKTNNL